MEDFSALDKLNVPIYICDDCWTVVFKNRACRKYSKIPIVRGNLSKYFVYPDSVFFPQNPGEADFVCCKLGEAYKTAVCLELYGYAAVVFPTVLDFDLLFGDISGKISSDYVGCMSDILKAIIKSNRGEYDKYGLIEKMRRLFFSSIENYVAFSMFDMKQRVLSPLEDLYGFFVDTAVKRLNKNGYRVTADIEGLNGFGNEILADTMFFSAVLSNLLLFVIGLSDGKSFRIEATLMGKYVKHEILFGCHTPLDVESQGTGLEGLSALDPCGYLNVYVFERLCSALGWRLYYEIDDGEEYNGKITLEIDDTGEALFNSTGETECYTPEEIVRKVVFETFWLI